jgi:hypothetical protein
MTDMSPPTELKPIAEYTDEDLAAYDRHIEVPFFWFTRQRFKAWRTRRALARRVADGDAVAPGEVAERDGLG